MNIIEYYYNDDNRMLHVEFSTEKDGDGSYRVLELILEDVMFYSPSIIHEDDTYNMDENDIIDDTNRFQLLRSTRKSMKMFMTSFHEVATITT